MSFTVESIIAREVLDSRGAPTVEAEVRLQGGAWGRAIVPSGASTGKHEALELRDRNKARFFGKGVLTAVGQVNGPIADALKGKTFKDIGELDRAMIALDPSAQKAHLGANSVLSISLAFLHAASQSLKQPLYKTIQTWFGSKTLTLPVPLMNIINGGAHANSGLAIQEFMIVPHGFTSFREALRAGVEIFHTLKGKLDEKGFSTAVGDEGGFAPTLSRTEDALELICQSTEAAGYRLGDQVSLALDVAASSFFDSDSGHYNFSDAGPRPKAEAMIEFYGNLVRKYPIVSLEDGLEEDDWAGWKALTANLGKQLQLVGDDLFVTQKSKVAKGIQEKTANAVLIKLNQVGSVTETFETMKTAFAAGYRCVVSHRSGETEDVSIAHLAVGTGAGQIKTGSLSRTDRIAKYNELLRIEETSAGAGNPIPFARLTR